MKNTPSEERAGKLLSRIEADEIVYSLVEKLVAAKEVKADAEAAVDALQIAVMSTGWMHHMTHSPDTQQHSSRRRQSL